MSVQSTLFIVVKFWNVLLLFDYVFVLKTQMQNLYKHCMFNLCFFSSSTIKFKVTVDVPVQIIFTKQNLRPNLIQHPPPPPPPPPRPQTNKKPSHVLYLGESAIPSTLLRIVCFVITQSHTWKGFIFSRVLTPQFISHTRNHNTSLALIVVHLLQKHYQCCSGCSCFVNIQNLFIVELHQPVGSRCRVCWYRSSIQRQKDLSIYLKQ